MIESRFEIGKVASKVFVSLLDRPETRDNDRQLCIEVWKKELSQLGIEDFFDAFANAKISHPETIRRARQKLQQEHEALRGKRWECRHQMGDEFSKKIVGILC